MSKDSHFTGQPVYSQVLKLIDKEKKNIYVVLLQDMTSLQMQKFNH